MRRFLLLLFWATAACGGEPTNNQPSDAGTRDAAGDVPSDLAGDMGFVDSGGVDVAPADLGGGELVDQALLAALRRDAEAVMTALGYNRARDRMYAIGGIDDRGGRIEGIYTGRTVDADGTRTPSGNCAVADGTPRTCAFNTEHTFARNHLRDALMEGTSDYDAAEGDLHHLFPSDETANNERSNFDFGTTDCQQAGNCAFDEQSQLGLPSGGIGRSSCPIGVDPGEDLCVMQVRPERRGDVARAHFYMSMRYELRLSTDVETVLRAWSAADLPDAVETDRNAAIETAQGNRNAFVDDPGLVDRIADF